MKKRFWVRLISAVLTMAMAFSILVVPASAAEADTNTVKLTAIGNGIVAAEGDEVIFWFTYDVYAERVRNAAEVWALYEAAAQTSSYIDVENPNGKVNRFYLYTGELPKDYVIGFSVSPESQIFWYEETNIDKIAAPSDIVLNPKTGVITVKDMELKPIGYTDSDPEDSISVSAAADSSTALLIVGGAAVAATAATGFYFYTHPEKVQEIKDSVREFVENIQNKFQSVFPNYGAEDALSD